MHVNLVIFRVLGTFFLLAGIAYSVWALITYGSVEWVGTIGFGLTCVMLFFISFYLTRSFKAQQGVLPEDRTDASVDDGDPELGFFSPGSWWPLLLAGTAGLGFVGLAVGTWLVFIAGVFFIVAITGWVYEYYRGYYAR